MSEQCSSCDSTFDGDTPRTTPCCEFCWRCEMCGCTCDDELQLQSYEEAINNLVAFEYEICELRLTASNTEVYVRNLARSSLIVRQFDKQLIAIATPQENVT